MKKQLEFQRSWELPPDWDRIDSLQETRKLAECTLHLRGYACQRRRDQKIVTGSWAGWEEPTLDKADYELHERLALMQAMDQPDTRIWPLLDLKGEKIGFTRGAMLFPASPDPRVMQFAKSNGVALGTSFQDAAHRAACELIERHLVLASWYGAFQPQPCTMPLPLPLQSLQSLYEFRLYDFGSFELKGFGRIHGRGCFLWPLDPAHPVIYGFGAAPDAKEAMMKALAEAIQRLAFLDPIECPEEEPVFAPTPDFHQEYFLRQERRVLLEAWLGGAASHPFGAVDICRSGEAQAVELSAEEGCPGHVVRVMLPGALPLVFGRFQPAAFPDLPERFWIHPLV
jgi:hypothetical protein